MFPTDSAHTHAMKTDMLDMDFSTEVDFRKRRRNRTTQSCLNCHTSKRKCDRKRPCQRCIQLGLTGLCVYEVDDPALRDDPDLDETTRLRNRIAELESLVRELRGKPHPRWADQSYFEGDASDKWHTRSQKRGNGVIRPKRTPGPDHSLIKTEPMSDVQYSNAYYRLSPSPTPLSATSTSYSMSVNHLGANHYSASGYSMSINNGGNTMSATSPATYSPSSASNSSGGFPGRSNNPYPHDDHCVCIADPAANHSFVALARQLESLSSYLQQLPGHPQASCTVARRIQDLKNTLHGDTSPKPPAASPTTIYSSGNYETHTHNTDSLRSPADTDLMTPLSITSSVGISAPTTPHSLHVIQWGHEGSNHPNAHVSTYFGNSEMYAKPGPYDVVA